MEGMQLPIDIVPGSNPPVFKWRQTVDTIAGRQSVEHREPMPPHVEVALARLVRVAKQLMFDNAGLQAQVVGLANRVAGQSEIIARQAEKEPTPAPAPIAHPKKGK